MLWYSVAHYFDVASHRRSNMYKNIDRHIGCFNSLNLPKKTFILISAINTPRPQEERYSVVGKHIESYCKDRVNEGCEVKIHVVYNWGGTISALWRTYEAMQDAICHDDERVAHFEEDFGPNDDTWYAAAGALLKDNIIYVGESNNGRIKMGNDDQRLTGRGFSGTPRLGMPEVWTDGGFYFSTMGRLREIASRVGIFHKGNQETKYSNVIDGISLGEVGFPTLLFHAGMKFAVLPRDAHFRHEWNG